MIKYKILTPISIVVFASFFIFPACNNNSEHIPFPEKELGYTQPVTLPLKFTEEKNLIWDTAKKGNINPLTIKLDLDALPSKPFDSTGFLPFSKAPEQSAFDYNSLPDTAFNFDTITARPIGFMNKLLGVIASVKAAPPTYQKDRPVAIADFGTATSVIGTYVTSLYRDKQGLLWIGSAKGIFRYDGDRIETVVPNISASVAGMAEDKNGRIWYIHNQGMGVIDMRKGIVFFSRNIAAVSNNIAPITVDNKGLFWVINAHDTALSIIDPETLTYKNITPKQGARGNGAMQVAEDENKNIWIPTATGGVNIIDRKLGKIKFLTTKNGLRTDTLSVITVDKTGKLWIGAGGTFSGIESIDVKAGVIKHYASDQGFSPKQFSFGLSFDNKGRLWKLNSGGVEIIDLEKGMRRSLDVTNGLAGPFILSSVQDNYNRIWLGSLSGINLIDNNAETVHPFGTTTVTSLMQDEQGNIWTATQGGLSIIDPEKKLVRSLNKATGLSDNFVQSFFQVDHKMMICTDGGINIFDPSRKTLERIGKKEGLLNDTCYAIFKDREGGTWLTGPSNGIDRIDSAKTFILHTDAISGLSDNNIGDIKQDQEGFLWLATNSGGIDVIDPKKGTVKYLNSEPGLKSPSNKSLLLDTYGRVWIGTASGIYIADTKNGTLTQISKKNGLASDLILSLLQYHGSVLAGTNIGSTIITAPSPADAASKTDRLISQWKISPMAKTQALQRVQANSWNTDAVTAAGQYLWGDIGITWINDIVPGLDSAATYITGMTVMTEPQHFRDEYSFGKNDTLRTADTFYVKDSKALSTLYTSKGLLWDSVAGPFNLPSGLEIPYHKNYIQFQFSQANLGRPDSTRYTYLLEGIDKNWSAVTNYPYTQNYLNLPSGKYTFKVSSKGISGKWSEPASFSFTITPPWYRTWWAYTLMALISVAILRVYIVYRSRRLQQENKVLEEKVTLRTEQLQKSLEELKATQTQLVQSEKMASLGELTAGIAHEIQNPLNFVNNFSEVSVELAAELKDELGKIEIPADKKANLVDILDDIVQNQEKINFHGKRADSIVKGMLQHSRSNSGMKEPTDINALTDEYFRLSYHGLRAKDNSFNALMRTDFDKTLKPVNIIPQDIGRVILNLFTNAFYAVSEKKALTPKGYEPTVSVSTKALSTHVEIRVRDNGMGVPQKVLDKIFQPFFTTKPTGQGTGLGLSLSYDIIKAHGGEIKVDTREGEFTEFVVRLPLTS